MLNPNEILPLIKYSFTVKPNNRFQFWGKDVEERVQKSQDYINQIMDENNCMLMTLYMHVTKTGRIQWQGTIGFVDEESISNFFLSTLHKWSKKQITEIGKINDMEAWEKYILKSFGLFPYGATNVHRIYGIVKMNEDNVKKDYVCIKQSEFDHLLKLAKDVIKSIDDEKEYN